MAILVASAVIVLAVFSPSPSREPPLSAEQRRPGSLSALPAFDFKKANATLLLVLNSSCQFCADSMPALRKIADACARTAGRTRCVAVSGESEPTLRAYVESHGLNISEFYSVSPETNLVEYAPRVVLVGRDARVRRDWLGFIDIGRADEMTKAILDDFNQSVAR